MKKKINELASTRESQMKTLKYLRFSFDSPSYEPRSKEVPCWISNTFFIISAEILRVGQTAYQENKVRVVLDILRMFDVPNL